MIFQAGTIAGDLIAHLQTQPDQWVPLSELVIELGCAASSIQTSSAVSKAIAGGYLQRRRRAPGLCAAYRMGLSCEVQGSSGGVRIRAAVSEEKQSVVVGTLRDLMFSGSGVPVGDPIKAIADALQAARNASTAAKASRFTGAETDVAIGREIRAITEAAQRAAHNLAAMVETFTAMRGTA